MKLSIEKVSKKNLEKVLSLQLLDAQKGYIETVAACLEEASENKAWRPNAIYDHKTLVGFTMYGLLEDGRVWLDRLLIDKDYQHQGYGQAAVQQLVTKLCKDYQVSEIFLSVYEENSVAVRLYQKIGFVFTGELDTKGEKVMVYRKKETDSM